MKKFGYVRVGTAVPTLSLGNASANALEIVQKIEEAVEKEIAIISFPELCVTGYTCGDLFLTEGLLTASLEALQYIACQTKDLNIISIIGMPIQYQNQLYNTAVVLSRGKILGVVPKTYIPNYAEFYEKRWFASGADLELCELELCGQKVMFGTNIIFEDIENKNIRFAIEICEDLWSVLPPSNELCLGGATMIFNLSSSPETIGKKEYRKNLVSMQSARLISAYIYASSGVMESSSDLVFSGASMIYENGTLLSEGEDLSFNSQLIYADIDVGDLVLERCKNISYMGVKARDKFHYIPVSVPNFKKLRREYLKYPFVPSSNSSHRFQEIINIQATALARRLVALNYPKCIIGMSGGLDSTLAFLICLEALKKVGKDASLIVGITMPGFGTTDRTYENAVKLVEENGATFKEISIVPAAKLHMQDIGLSSEDRSVVYENIQARERTQILMDVANQLSGIVIGTGDLSELALGWCTYNGDHMSMYAVNASIPKTLVRHLVQYFADTVSDKCVKDTLIDILDTPISPELLPPDQYGKIKQKTESKIGPYVLHDFFLYHFLRRGENFKKIEFLANQTFSGEFSKKEIKQWLSVFIKRFFTQQFKRNCMPDSVKIGSVSLSPRGDLRLPSEINYLEFLGDI